MDFREQLYEFNHIYRASTTAGKPAYDDFMRSQYFEEDKERK